MSITWWSLVRFLHVLSAMVWVGGQLVLSGVVLPVLRQDLAPDVRAVVVPKAARRFGNVANSVLLPLLLATGLALAYHRGVGFNTFRTPATGGSSASSWPWSSSRSCSPRRTGSWRPATPDRPGRSPCPAWVHP